MTEDPWIHVAVHELADPDGRIKRVVSARGWVAAGIQVRPGEGGVLLTGPIDTAAWRVAGGALVPIEEVSP